MCIENIYVEKYGYGFIMMTETLLLKSCVNVNPL